MKTAEEWFEIMETRDLDDSMIDDIVLIQQDAIASQQKRVEDLESIITEISATNTAHAKRTLALSLAYKEIREALQKALTWTEEEHDVKMWRAQANNAISTTPELAFEKWVWSYKELLRHISHTCLCKEGIECGYHKTKKEAQQILTSIGE